ncbi:MAG: SUMF1/EgtB/PvdO family nonheme iron enzyme [Flavobacteriales bacterium]|nr:SUMF1/EgtB/PvdO family nonheme iron enzyme [Flavobacteriales bacterium]
MQVTQAVLKTYITGIILVALSACNQLEGELLPVSYAQFEMFVNETDYVTDAEKYGWSIVQQDVYNFYTADSAVWTKPDGVNKPPSKDLPVTQVSYNDAIAYCKWAGARLPTYDEFWEYVKTDERLINDDYRKPISPVDEVNIVGNVWDITEASHKDSVRLAGGSLFCSKNTCDGTIKARVLYVDKETGNIHIGFSVIKTLE